MYNIYAVCWVFSVGSLRFLFWSRLCSLFFGGFSVIVPTVFRFQALSVLDSSWSGCVTPCFPNNVNNTFKSEYST